jgi:hypothetical protein
MFLPRLPRSAAFLAIALMFGALWIFPGAAHSESVYTVAGVTVDSSATSAAEARSVALAEGQRAAYDRLLRRIVLAEDQVLLPVLENADIAALIDGFVIDKELVSSTRYRATLIFDFNKNGVRKLLRQRKIRFAETRSNDMLVVPVFDNGDGATLWFEPGDWREAWLGRPIDEGLVSLVLPLGDVIDMAAIDANQALAPSREAVMGLAERYGTQEVVVASAYLAIPEHTMEENAPTTEGGGLTPAEGAQDGALDDAQADLSQSRRVRGEVEGAILELTVHRVGVAGDSSSTELLRGGPSESLQELLARAVARVLARVEGAWKQANMLRFGRENELSILVPLKSLSDWVDIRRRLGDLAVVVSIDLDALSRNQADITLHYFGETEQLMLGIEQSDLALDFEARGWVLQAGGASRQSETGENRL